MHANGGSAYYYQQPRFGTLPPLSSSSPQSHHYATSTILDDEPVWARADTIDPRQRSPPPHGYQPPSVRGATPQQMTVVHSSAKPVPDSDIYRVGIYGWRKRCLYAFILALTLVVFINLAFTFWIMTVLDFSLGGMGALKIEEDRIRVVGRSEFEKPVQFSQLSSADDQALSIDSALGVSISAHNHTGHSTAALHLQPDGKAQMICDRFEVLDEQKKSLFFVDSNEIGLKLENLRILDDGGSVFEGAIQTAIIRPEPDSHLRIESPTRSLIVEAGQDIEMLSSAGEIHINSLFDIQLRAKQGNIRLESSNIFMSGLEKSMGVGGASQYQLCVCQNGRLFLANERADCRADKQICS
ncbi:unnamed protein product [Meloidogyne enterolobii]|uniref:Uncharacterized protein n=1 Tax=Meloidogyne enterolobii TaxID=390850 RepID=A0ACB0YQE5_MELEN